MSSLLCLLFYMFYVLGCVFYRYNVKLFFYYNINVIFVYV